jgi:ornithine carbamoyltransferase
MESLKGRDLLGLADLSQPEATYLLNLAAQMKLGEVVHQSPRILGLLFQKASTRTRVSFTVAMYQLGGQVIDLNPQSTQVSRGEPLEDTARVLDRYLDVLAIRTFKQSDLETIAHLARIPVINALTDQEHPCQVLADLLTAQESFGSLSGLTLTYVGDGNNVAHSLMLGCALLGVNVRVATPPGYEPAPTIVAKAQELAVGKTEVVVTTDAKAAVSGAQVVYTDVWASMGQESEAQVRKQAFAPYQLNETLMQEADPQAIVLHCLPAHRGEEITEAVLEGPQSRVWEQAENRMHVQKALLASILS